LDLHPRQTQKDAYGVNDNDENAFSPMTSWTQRRYYVQISDRQGMWMLFEAIDVSNHSVTNASNC
jgi:hypothetical protein